MTASWLQLRFGNGSHMAALARGQPSLSHLRLHPHDGAQAACVERDKKWGRGGTLDPICPLPAAVHATRRGQQGRNRKPLCRVDRVDLVICRLGGSKCARMVNAWFGRAISSSSTASDVQTRQADQAAAKQVASVNQWRPGFCDCPFIEDDTSWLLDSGRWWLGGPWDGRTLQRRTHTPRARPPARTRQARCRKPSTKMDGDRGRFEHPGCIYTL